MSESAALIYCYDGSFAGFLCCVFESYDKRELPLDIASPERAQGSLLASRWIATDQAKAHRVAASLPRRLGGEVAAFVRQAFWTCLSQKELLLLRFLRLAYRVGPSVLLRLTDDAVAPLAQAVRHLERESHLFKGFVRFVETNGALVAAIEPKNFVLPRIAAHFCNRYPEERFLIHDRTHGAALVYAPYRSEIVALAALETPRFGAEEAAFQSLWQAFYEAVEIKERHNPKCRQTQMPKRYWKHMTEFAAPDEAPPGGLPERGVAALAAGDVDGSKQENDCAALESCCAYNALFR